MQELALLQPAPEYVEAERALAQRLRYDQWSDALKAAHARRTAGWARHLLRFQLFLGAIVAAASLVFDLAVLPDKSELALFWRLFTIAPLTFAGLVLLARGRLQPAKLMVSASVVCLGMVAMHFASFGNEALMTRYAMATVFLLGIACMALPFTPTELRRFAMAFTLLTSLAAMWPNPLDPLTITMHLTFAALVASAAIALAKKNWEIAARGFLKDLREEATLEALEQSNLALRQLSEQDPLTGMPNRRHFERVLGDRLQALSPERSDYGRLALMMIDLDRFKEFNDRHGHLAGDRCLKLVAQELQAIFPKEYGVLARYGGEEFIAALREREPGEAERLAEAMRQAVADLLVPVDQDAAPLITTSIGVALAPANSSLDIDDLIEMADVALYKAKNKGRNRVETIVAGTMARRSA